MQLTLDELKAKLLEENLKQLFEQAYKQGVEDAQSQYSLPHVLTKEHLKEILQVEMPTVDKIVKRSDFPKFTVTRARYPRDEVFKWITKNTNWVMSNTNYFQSIS